MKKSLGADTLIFPTPTWLVGTYDKENRPNLITVAWGGVCCSKPPCLTISLREATYSYNNILDRKAYTVGVPSVDQVRQADYCGMVSGRKVDKFLECGFTPVKSQHVDAPYAAEVAMVLECRLIHHYKLGLHTHFVGEIIDVKVEEEMLGANDAPLIEKIRPIIYAPGKKAYYAVGQELGAGFSLGKELKK